MEKQAYSQLELFSQDTPRFQPKPCASSRVLSFLKQYEKAVVILMVFLVTSVVSFSLGVEKGKKMFASSSSMRMDMAMARGVLRPAALAAGPQEKYPLPEQKARPQVAPLLGMPAQPTGFPAQNVKEKKQGNFTLQLASYRKQGLAKKEAAALSKKGITASVLARGNYFILCSGNFPSQQAAKILLAKSRKSPSAMTPSDFRSAYEFLLCDTIKKHYQDCIVRRL